MECNFPICQRHAQNNGYCIFHRIYASGSGTIEKPKELPKVSNTTKSVKQALKTMYPSFLHNHPLCEVKSPNCTTIATCVHHTKGRGKNEVLNQETWKSSCDPCNLWVEVNHAEAEKMDMKISRHQIDNSHE
jgi:hypothetical protein